MKPFLLVVLFLLLSSCSLLKVNCHSNWKITGFYTPIASSYSSHLNKTIKVRDFGSINFNTDFLKNVKLEGWGKTRFGWYLGFYSNQWHKSNYPLNALGHPLNIGAIAVDNNVIFKDSSVRIPSMLKLLGYEHFQAVDVGSAIKKNISIFILERVMMLEN